MVEASSDFPIIGMKSFGRGNNGKGKSAEKGSVFDEGPLLVKEKGGEEGGVAGVKDLGASGALAGEWDGLTNRKRAEEELEGRLLRNGRETSVSGRRS
jgi:hypothetical protein